MTDLDRLLVDLPIEPAPLDELLVTGHHLRLRRRLIGAGLACVLVLVAGGLALLGGPDGPGERAVDPAGGGPPTVAVIGMASPGFEQLYAEVDGAEPFWDAETESVYYVSSPGYSSSCPPIGRTTYEDGVMTLTLAADPGDQDQVCTADAGVVIAVVGQVPEKPDELTIGDVGTQRTLPLLEGFPVVVHSELVGPEVAYVEGARVQTSIQVPGGVERHAVVEVGTMSTFRGVPVGASTLKGATRVCTGSCDALSEPTDTCAAPLEVDGATEAVLTFRWGSPCRVGAP